VARRPKNSDLLNALFATARAEAAKRKGNETWAQKAGHLRTMLMGIQAILESDPAKRIAVRSPRQTGKSTGVMLIVTIRCLEKAGAEWVVLGLTRPSVKRIYWAALKELNKAFELGIEFQHQELTATFKNGSQISFAGSESISEIEKFRGGRYDGVVIDECKSFGPKVFRELVEDVLEPALMAKDGQLYIIGTPGDWLDGPFYMATCETPIIIETPGEGNRQSNALFGTTPQYEAMWSLHSWTLPDNTTRFERKDGSTYTMWDQALEVKRKNGWNDTHPTWRREYLGHWVADDHRRVFHYKTLVNDYYPTQDGKWGLPFGVADKDWQTVIGVDFGTRDGTAMVVWAFHPHERGLWELYSEVRSVNTKQVREGDKLVERGERLSVTDVALWYKELETEYGPFQGWPADPAGLATMVMDTLASEHQVYLEPAEKAEKLDHIDLLNTDLDNGLIHIRRGSVLSEQLAAGKWDEKMLEKGKKVEDRNIPNDVSDAGLYAYRWCNHRRAKDRKTTTQMYTAAWWQAQADAELQAAKEKARQRLEPDQSLDKEWWS
jgi:terminase large subunit-like protein